MEFCRVPADDTVGWVTLQYTRLSWRLSHLHTSLLLVYYIKQRSVHMSCSGLRLNCCWVQPKKAAWPGLALLVSLIFGTFFINIDFFISFVQKQYRLKAMYLKYIMMVCYNQEAWLAGLHKAAHGGSIFQSLLSSKPLKQSA